MRETHHGWRETHRVVILQGLCGELSTDVWTEIGPELIQLIWTVP